MCEDKKPRVWYCLDDLEDTETRAIIEESKNIEADLEEIDRIATIAREIGEQPSGTFSTT
jgi:hypothetical protein